MPVGHPRNKIFTFVVTPEERADIDELAQKLDRTASDAVRLALRSAVSGVRQLATDGEEDDAD